MSNLPAAQLLLAARQYLQSGHYSRAIQLLKQVLESEPDSFPAHSLLGIAYQNSGNPAAAIAHFQTALALQPGWIEGHELLGRTLAALGRYEQAAVSLDQAVRLRPEFVEARNNLASVLRLLRQTEEAIAHLRIAKTLRPESAEISNNLANALLDQGETIEALAEMKRAVALRPEMASLHQGLGNAQIGVGQVDEAIETCNRALKLDPSQHHIHSSMLLAMHYLDRANDDPQELFKAHLRYARPSSITVGPISRERDLSPHRRLRVGYVSADFRQHSVAFFIEPLLANHDADQFEIYCYSDVTFPDAVTDRFKHCCSQWREVAGRSDQQVAELTASDQIDILIDLAGHSGSRLGLFRHKAAPLQVSYLGYPDTTGLAEIDYRITDAIVDPAGEADQRCTEKLVRITPPFLCYKPPVDAPEVCPPPFLGNGRITFGSFNKLAKISAGTIELWSGVLRSVASSRMLIKAAGLQRTAAAERLIAAFAGFGIESDRLLFLGHEGSTGEHLARYQQVDIALDTFPYNGTTTTCEALWMGVPVISRRGNIHAARVGATLLRAIGQHGWVADSVEEFTRIAVQLAVNGNELALFRNTLRSQLDSSPITDASGFARRFEAALRRMWLEYTAKIVDSSTAHGL